MLRSPKTLTGLLSLALTLAVVGSSFAADGRTADELVKEIEAKVDAMQGQLDASYKALEQARSSRNFKCIEDTNEAISGQKGLVRLARQNLKAAQEAAAKGDLKTVEHAHVTTGIAEEKVNSLAGKVRVCGSQPGEPGAAGPAGAAGEAGEQGEEDVEVLGEADSPLGPSYSDTGAAAGSGQGQLGRSPNGFGDPGDANTDGQFTSDTQGDNGSPGEQDVFKAPTDPTSQDGPVIPKTGSPTR